MCDKGFTCWMCTELSGERYTSHGKFREQYLKYVTQHIAPLDLHYLIVNHTEPDHSGLIKEILDWAPHVIVVGSKVAIQFLENMLHR